MRRLRAWYDRRIVNVNVNIIAAGLAAMGITVATMHLAERTGLLARLIGWTGKRHFRVGHYQIHTEKLTVSGLTFLVDLVADVLVYYALHWFANHSPSRKAREVDPGYADLSFMRDASLVQFERALLSPVLYLAALGLQSKLLHEGQSVAVATAAGFSLGIILSRTLHTLWMLRMERLAGVRTAADIVGPDVARDNPPRDPAP